MKTPSISHLTVPLGSKIHAIARSFAAEQTTPQKGKKIYLNTLAVYAVHSYLKWLQIETDLSGGSSWHSGLRSLFDVADLVLPGVGKLECCPLLPGETALSLPPEVTGDRIGYVAVQFDEDLNEVELLGFANANDVANSLERISIADLQSLDILLDYIPANSNQSLDAISVFTASKKQVNLRSWLEDIFEAGWQTVDALSSMALIPALSVRSIEVSRKSDREHEDATTSGGKLIDLGMQVVDRAVALIIRLEPVADAEVDIRLRVYPTSGQNYLPLGLQLILLDEVGTTCLIATARNADNCLQMQFSGNTGEQFSVKLVLGEFSTEEYFII